MKEDVLAKLREAKSAEELIAIAKEGGKELTAEQAKELLDALHGAGELSDGDLANVAGGLTKVPGVSSAYIKDGYIFHDIENLTIPF